MVVFQLPVIVKSAQRGLRGSVVNALSNDYESSSSSHFMSFVFMYLKLNEDENFFLWQIEKKHTLVKLTACQRKGKLYIKGDIYWKGRE